MCRRGGAASEDAARAPPRRPYRRAVAVPRRGGADGSSASRLRYVRARKCWFHQPPGYVEKAHVQRAHAVHATAAERGGRARLRCRRWVGTHRRANWSHAASRSELVGADLHVERQPQCPSVATVWRSTMSSRPSILTPAACAGARRRPQASSELTISKESGARPLGGRASATAGRQPFC